MTSKLLQRGSHEAQDELESTLAQAYLSCQGQLLQVSTATAAQRIPLTQALLYAVLIQPQNAPPTALFNHLTAISNDGYASFVAILIRLVNDSYQKLLDQPKAQVIWLLRQLIPLQAVELDSLCNLLLRQIVGGDVSPSNVWLANQMLDVLKSNLNWVTGNAGLLTSAVYTYLRLLPDHSKNSSFSELRQAEIKFCSSMLREHFQECSAIGRDLVRILQDVSAIPEFEAIWRDLLCNPAIFRTAGFTDISQLYMVRTPARYLQSRLTPEMESQIKFMLTHVRMGNQRRYQSWFTQRFLTSSDSETLVCDLLRYICCVHHPSNQILQSDILPRWALVGWLLKCCKSNHVEANAKLALLYDWLFFVPKTDNIMNIEPAILVMVHSIPKYADMTNALLEFLFLLIENYDPLRRDFVQRGVAASMDILVGKGVVRSLEPLIASSAIAGWLRDKLAQNFPAYCRADVGENLKGLKSKQDSAPKGPGSLGRDEIVEAASGDPTNRSHSTEDKGDTSSDNSVVRKRKRSNTHTPPDPTAAELEKLTKALAVSQDEAMKVLESALASPTSEEKAEKFAFQITEVLKKGGYEMFSHLLSAPSSKPEGDETMSITSTLFRLYVGQYSFPHMRSMLVSWSSEGFAVGARLLCYVSRLCEELESMTGLLSTSDASGRGDTGSSSQSDLSEDEGGEKNRSTQGNKKRLQSRMQQAFHTAVSDGFKAYEAFLRASVLQADGTSSASKNEGTLDEDVKASLLGDLKTCLVWNILRLQRVLPSVFRYLPSLAAGNEKLMHLAVSVLNPADMLNMELRISFGEFTVLGGQENATKLIKASTAWESIEQQFFWRLLAAEVQGRGTLTSSDVLKICSSLLVPEAETEALAGLLSLMRSTAPNLQLASMLLGLPPGFVKLVVGVFTSWMLCSFSQLLTCMNQLHSSLNSGEKSNWSALDAVINHFEMNQNLEEQRRATMRQALLKLAATTGSGELTTDTFP